MKPMTSGLMGNISLDYSKSFLTRASNYDSLSVVDSMESWNKLFEDSLKSKNIIKWMDAVESNHGNFHCTVGGCDTPRGLFGTMWSPLDPLFYAHHSFVDFIWFQAQAGWAKANVDLKLQVRFIRNVLVTNLHSLEENIKIGELVRPIHLYPFLKIIF